MTSSNSRGLCDSRILLTLQVSVDLNSRVRGQVLELMKARLILQDPWERSSSNTQIYIPWQDGEKKYLAYVILESIKQLLTEKTMETNKAIHC